MDPDLFKKKIKIRTSTQEGHKQKNIQWFITVYLNNEFLPK